MDSEQWFGGEVKALRGLIGYRFVVRIGRLLESKKSYGQKMSDSMDAAVIGHIR
jgi:hypothetical protein